MATKPKLFKLTAAQRLTKSERAQMIAALGMAPEPAGVGPFHPEAYPASHGELVLWTREQGIHGPWGAPVGV
jgi:hypothetical protein